MICINKDGFNIDLTYLFNDAFSFFINVFELRQLFFDFVTEIKQENASGGANYEQIAKVEYIVSIDRHFGQLWQTDEHIPRELNQKS